MVRRFSRVSCNLLLGSCYPLLPTTARSCPGPWPAPVADARAGRAAGVCRPSVPVVGCPGVAERGNAHIVDLYRGQFRAQHLLESRYVFCNVQSLPAAEMLARERGWVIVPRVALDECLVCVHAMHRCAQILHMPLGPGLVQQHVDAKAFCKHC